MSRLSELNAILHKLRTYAHYGSQEEVNNDIERAMELAREEKNESIRS